MEATMFYKLDIKDFPIIIKKYGGKYYLSTDSGYLILFTNDRASNGLFELREQARKACNFLNKLITKK